jgi:hypothetical protein
LSSPAGPLPGNAYWLGADEYLQPFGAAAKKRGLQALQAQLGASDWIFRSGTLRTCALRCFVDTRVPMTVRAPVGDQFFVHLARSDQTIYHVHRGDVEHLRIIRPDDVAECFDRWFAHVLSRTPGEFDFMPFSVPLRG